ncbi:hypothetical protein ACMD2_23861 [Ananas comosus]|uniref:Uncharacterized protein n=1 Tax=Ananas comosus TaxID=4615 RepID=A0A199W3U8_ANACO|nr:hypothetical protein ACMD2_23861 [Ananas comosus]
MWCEGARLKPYHPNQRRKVPRTTSEALCPRRATGARRGRSARCAGPSIRAAQSPARPADHVDHPEPAKSITPDLNRRASPAVRDAEPSRLRTRTSGTHRVHEAREEGRVDEVGHELGALRYGPRGDPRRGRWRRLHWKRKKGCRSRPRDPLEPKKCLPMKPFEGPPKAKAKPKR